MKRVLFLGGASTQVPAIKYARSSNYYVITADYLPDNPGHRLSHEYHNCSTTDMKGILTLAKELSIDGIVAYASDPAAPTAAFVAEELGLPSNSFKTVKTLTSKDLYRKFLLENGFRCPKYKSFYSLEETHAHKNSFNLPVVLKPIDSSGSKGITVLNDWDQLKNAFVNALSISRAKRVIVEEFVGEIGEQILGEGFVWQGKLIVSCFAKHRFNQGINGLVPIGGDFPTGSAKLQGRLRSELQAFIEKVDLKMGPLNLEFRIDQSGEVYLMEVAPRNGGNMIPQLITFATGFDMVKNTVDIAVGLDCDQTKIFEMKGFYSYYVVHSKSDGRLKRMTISKNLEERICVSNLWTKPGDEVHSFIGANRSLGVLILSFSSKKEMASIMDNIHEFVNVELE
jgi:biotin carboxylase